VVGWQIVARIEEVVAPIVGGVDQVGMSHQSQEGIPSRFGRLIQ
jgi:hypothetical protein